MIRCLEGNVRIFEDAGLFFEKFGIKHGYHNTELY